MIKANFNTVLLFWSIGLFAQNKPHIAFINATAHIGNGQVIEKSLFVINGNKIESIVDVTGIKLNPSAFDTVIDLSDKHLYPALINVNNILGLHDAEAVRATADFAEVGQLNPHIRALIAYNTDNQIIPTVKTNGVLYTQVTPRGGLISGSSSIMALEGWNWEDAVLKADDGIHVNFPSIVETRMNESNEQYKKRQKHFQDEMQKLNHFFREAKAYCNSETKPETNLRFEAMKTVFSGTARLYLHTNSAKDILNTIAFVQQHTIKYPVLVGAKESYKVVLELKKSGIPVMLNRVNDLPLREDDDLDIVFKLPALLQKDSILFCLQLEGDMEAMQSRNLPFNAGNAVAYGLSKEEALAAISLNAAKIMGVSHILGSLEENKLASFVVSNGDLLDMKSNAVVMAFISGKAIQLNNKQTELYQKYLNKYRLK
ncbi:MAG: amidohydrolase family protein [Bacteroidia bacterium]|jgi:imidazolonepropionase-like amidohydrolase|nr:amidohydrolase family protein [Bacteroidia bacterium]